MKGIRRLRLASEVARQVELPATTVRRVVDQLYATMRQRLMEGSAVRLNGIGLIYTLSTTTGDRLLKFKGSRQLKSDIRKFLLLD